MISLLYLKHAFNVSDEALVVAWSQNVLWQFFSAQVYFEHRLPGDPRQAPRRHPRPLDEQR
jgi:IS5 family transposase